MSTAPAAAAALDAPEEHWGVCRNTNCQFAGQAMALHTGGLCIACCPKVGPLDCVDCEFDRDDPDD